MLYYIILAAIAALWRPSSNSKRYAYARLSTTDNPGPSVYSLRASVSVCVCVSAFFFACI